MATAIPNIWQMQTQGDVDGLIDALRHTDAGVRQRAAGALRAIGAWHAVPALENALAVEPDWKAHAALSSAIQYLDRDVHIEQMVKARDVRGLTKMLSSTRIDDVVTAAAALGEIGDRLATEALIVVFRNPFGASQARLAAAEALLKLESAPSVVTLLRALRRDDWAVRRNAAAVLGQLQATWAVEPLANALKDTVPIVRKTAEAALARIGTAEAMAVLANYERTGKPADTKPLPHVDNAATDQASRYSSSMPVPKQPATKPLGQTPPNPPPGNGPS
jgi:HEAT repeat protein